MQHCKSSVEYLIQDWLKIFENVSGMYKTVFDKVDIFKVIAALLFG